MNRARSLPGFEERQLVIPKGSVLTNEEIAVLLTQADERKRRGESWITVVDAPDADGYQVRVPRSATITREETIVMLSRLNEAKEYGHADLLITYADHVIVKSHLTIKGRGLAGGGPTITGPASRRRAAEF